MDVWRRGSADVHTSTLPHPHTPMRLLYLSPEPPVPPYSGGRERARQVLGYLARRHAVSLLTYAAREDERGLAALRPELAGLVALPYPVSGQAYSDPLRAAAIELA